ncbi:MAG: TolC family protein [Candidatus Zixiibacteriota bacterium]
MNKRILIAIFICIGLAVNGSAETVLTVEKVRERALEYNRQLQSARQEPDRSSGEIISARSGALPQLSLEGRYTRNIESQTLFFGDEKIPIGLKNDFSLSLSLTQPLYVGGKVGSALKIAKIYKNYSEEKVLEVESDVVYGAEQIFYAALMSQSQCDVIKSAYDQMSHNLEVVEKFYSQGMVSEFEFLRAKVEKMNLEPQLIAVESQKNILTKQLKSFLGYPLDENIVLLSDFSDTTLAGLVSMNELTAKAIGSRPEMKQATLQKQGYKNAIRIAKGDWLYPSVYFNTAYGITGSSDNFKLNDRNSSNSWSASLMVSVPLFDGGRSIGEVRKAKTDYHQAQLSELQMRDDIKLEVEQAYDALLEAKKSLDVVQETIIHAEEGMRIANLRYKTGVGTQLEILSAQTALTDAKTNMAGAIYNFRLAKAALKKASGTEIN